MNDKTGNARANDALGKSQRESSEARLAQLEKYLASDASNDMLRADAFGLALSAGLFDRAEQLLQDARTTPETTAVWQYRAGLLALARHRWDEARDRFEGLRRNGENNLAIAHNMAYIAFQSGDYQAVHDELSAWCEDARFEDASQTLWLRAAHRLRMYTQALARAEQWQRVQRLGAQAAGVASLIAMDAGVLVRVPAWARFALQHVPQQPEALVALGSIALGQRDAEDATRYFDEAIVVQPEDGRAWSGCGFARLMAQDIPGARAAFTNAVRYMPSHIGTWHGKAWAAILVQDWPDARAALEHALALDRNFAETHGALAVVAFHEHRLDDARHAIALAQGLDAQCMTAGYAQALLEGTLSDAAAVRRMAESVLRRQASVNPSTSIQRAAAAE